MIGLVHWKKKFAQRHISSVWKEPGSIFVVLSLQVFVRIKKSPWCHLFPRLESLSSLCLFSKERCSSGLITWMALHWILSSVFMSLLHRGAQNWTLHSRHSLASAEYWGRITSLHLLALFCLMESRYHCPSLQQGHIPGSHLTWSPSGLPGTFLPSCFQLCGPHWCLRLFLPKRRTM